jgi:hypothetical protein
LLTGAVLINGIPPGRLPSDILEHPTYKRLFGNRDFEISRNSGGSLQTTMKIDGRYFYEFFMHGEKIHIKEIDSKNEKNSLTLVDFTFIKWPSSLPVRLLKMHSHWYNETLNVVLLNGIEYNQRDVQFLIDLNDSKCYIVESNSIYSQLPFSEIFEKRSKLNQMINLKNTECLKILEKFESKNFIHTHLNIENQVQIQFPRFHLNFVSDSNGILHSEEHRGYYLIKHQNLTDSLLFFDHYLVLRKDDNSPLMLLVPNGRVENNSGKTRISMSDTFDSHIEHHVLHESSVSKTFKSSNIASRLQWAAILASSIIIPDNRFKMTGSEAAIDLIRQCIVNRPLTIDENAKLKDVFQYSFHEASLTIICQFLKSTSDRISFLHPSAESMHLQSTFIKEAGHDYENSVQHQENFRKILIQDEYKLNAGRKTFTSQKNKKFVQINTPNIVDEDFVSKIEIELKGFVKMKNLEKKDFPIDIKGANTLEKEMMDELKESWEKYMDTKVADQLTDMKSILKYITNKIPTISLKIHEFEDYLSSCCDTFPEDEKIKRKLLISANLHAIPVLTDFMKATYDEEYAQKLNPFFNKKSIQIFQKSCIKYLELCSLNQKLKRLISLKSDENLFMRELRVTREWKIEEHPRWLVFEVEGEIQIRNEQYQIANHLIQNPGAISQLNMGEGKTRVILPMLILYYISRKKSVRVHIMKPLLQETIDFFHFNLTATTLNVFLLEQPFHRDISLTPREARILKNIVNNGCCMIISPEYRLSMKLKALEIKDSEPKVKLELDKVFEISWINIIDESDALMDFKYQLTYSVGSPSPLSDLDSRYKVAEVILRTLNESENLNQHFENSKFGSLSKISSKCQYKKFYLSPLTDETKIERKKFKSELLKEIFHKFSPELYWIKDLDSKDLQYAFEDVLEIEKEISPRFSEFKWFPQLLALRGFLGHGILEHCLEQIHRVNFGISEKRKKRLAVPFKHADVPSDRSEFSHPDVSIIFTLLAYYHEGLTKDQFKECIATILKFGIPAQKYFYSLWYQPISDEIEKEEKLRIDNVIKIDLTNQSQIDLLYEKLKYSTEVVNFWLNFHVFTTDTAQYPKRISSSAFDLAEGSHTVGFSGTKDNHRLLPLQVKQFEPDIPSLIGTNGKMLDLILKKTVSFEVLNLKNLTPKNKIGHLLLDFAIESKVNALIDTGTMLACCTGS